MYYMDYISYHPSQNHSRSYEDVALHKRVLRYLVIIILGNLNSLYYIYILNNYSNDQFTNKIPEINARFLQKRTYNQERMEKRKKICQIPKQKGLGGIQLKNIYYNHSIYLFYFFRVKDPPKGSFSFYPNPSEGSDCLEGSNPSIYPIILIIFII